MYLDMYLVEVCLYNKGHEFVFESLSTIPAIQWS